MLAICFNVVLLIYQAYIESAFIESKPPINENKEIKYIQ